MNKHSVLSDVRDFEYESVVSKDCESRSEGSSPQQPGPRVPVILVCPFTDGRPFKADQPSWVECRPNEAALPGWPGNLAPDSGLITSLFVSALKRAGYDLVFHHDMRELSTHPAPGAVALDGRLWSFCFETVATTILNVDVSLSLRAQGNVEPLWRLEFPGDTLVPFWIGLGCDPQDMVGEALREVEEAAFLQFSSPGFGRAIRQGALVAPASQLVDVDDSHEVIPSPSWTGTEEGAVKAIAREAAWLKPHEAIPTADLYDPVFRHSDRKTDALAKAPAIG